MRKVNSKGNRVILSALMILAPILPALAVVGDEIAGLQWQFDVSLNGKPVGYHSFAVRQNGSKQILETEASFDVKFLFVTAFRYRHQNTEVWDDGCLRSIDATTDSNGKNFRVRGTSSENSFDLSSNAGSSTLSGCVQTFAYWNPAVLESERLLNTQTGEYEDVTVTFEEREQIEVGGKPVDALRYRLSAKAGDITLWYSSEGRTWLGLEAPAKGGRIISYDAVSVPDPYTAAPLVAGSS